MICIKNKGLTKKMRWYNITVLSNVTLLCYFYIIVDIGEDYGEENTT